MNLPLGIANHCGIGHNAHMTLTEKLAEARQTREEAARTFRASEALQARRALEAALLQARRDRKDAR